MQANYAKVFELARSQQIQENTKLNSEIQVISQKKSGAESRRKRDTTKFLQVAKFTTCSQPASKSLTRLTSFCDLS